MSKWRPFPGPIPARSVLCPPVHRREPLRGSWTCRRRLSIPTVPHPERKRGPFSEESMGWAHLYWDNSGLGIIFLFWELQCHFDHELGGVYTPVSWFLSREMTSHCIGTRINNFTIVLTPLSHFPQTEEWMSECVSASAPNMQKHSKGLGHETSCWIMLPSCCWKAVVWQYLSVHTSQLQTAQGNPMLYTLWSTDG